MTSTNLSLSDITWPAPPTWDPDLRRNHSLRVDTEFQMGRREPRSCLRKNVTLVTLHQHRARTKRNARSFRYRRPAACVRCLVGRTNQAATDDGAPCPCP